MLSSLFPFLAIYRIFRENALAYFALFFKAIELLY